MTKKMAVGIDAARQRTISTKLAGSTPVLRTADAMSRTAYVVVRQGAVIEYLDMMMLTNSRETTQNLINERNRKDASLLSKGRIDPYLRVAKIEIREVEEVS